MMDTNNSQESWRRRRKKGEMYRVGRPHTSTHKCPSDDDENFKGKRERASDAPRRVLLFQANTIIWCLIGAHRTGGDLNLNYSFEALSSKKEEEDDDSQELGRQFAWR